MYVLFVVRSRTALFCCMTPWAVGRVRVPSGRRRTLYGRANAESPANLRSPSSRRVSKKVCVCIYIYIYI